MSNMQSAPPIAIAFGDVHLTLVQPACRADKDWMAVQAGYLKQVRDIASELGNVPILCAGDIFDRWNPSPELINFALEYLPIGMMCVPGQHDLPNHQIEAMDRSGYGVLRKARKIIDIAGADLLSADFNVWGFGWNQEIKSMYGKGLLPRIALIHRYVWVGDKKYPDAPDTAHVGNLTKELKGYDVAITGDNHKSFLAKADDCWVCNCGTFIRRKSDEMFHQPCVAVIYSDGTVKRRKLDVSGDLFHEDIEERSEVPIDMRAFIDGLEKLGEHGLDFREAVRQHIKTENIDAATAQIILAAIQ